MKNFFAGIILSIFSPALAFPQTVRDQIAQLKCEQLNDPIAVESQHPALSWHMTGNFKGKNQRAYRIMVASSPALLQQNKGDYWDSQKVNSENSVQVAYRGKPLPSGKKLYWKVMLWDESGKASSWSRPATWSMGLLQPADWKAKWIGAFENPFPDSAITYPAPFFRKEFVSGKKIKQAVVHLSGLGFYELYLNGKKIGNQVLAPAVSNYDQRPLKRLLYPYDDQSTQRVYYNTFDLSKSIGPDKNTIGILLGNGWYNQRDRRVEGDMWYDAPKLIFQLEILYTDGTKKTIVSDESWETSTGPLLKDGIFTGEKYDARISMNNWKPAILVRPPTGMLRAQHAPFDQVARTITPKFEGKIKDSVYVYQLEETVSGWAAIQVNGKAGSKLKIRYISEEGDDYGQIDEYILKGGGPESWEPKFTWHAFRKIEVSSADVVLSQESLKVKDVHTAVNSNGSFECSNPFLNTIYQAYLKTQRANLHGSVSSDCPHRERLGYTGDGQVIMESSIYAFDVFRFYRKWLDDMDDARNKKTGFVTHTAPFGGGGGGPAWGSAYVIMPWHHYTYYGDTSILKSHYQGMKQWVEYLSTRTDKDGLVSREEPNGWCLGDWCTPTGVQIPAPLVNTAYFYHVTELMGRVSKVLGKEEDHAKFLQLARKIQADFNKAYYNSSTGSYWEGRQGSDVFALAFGLVPAENYQRVFSSLLAHLKQVNYHFDTGILGTPLLLKVLAQNGRNDLAYQLMNQKDFPGFGYLQDARNSTLWESWNGDGSHSHPMFGSVVEWMYTAIAGIRTDPTRPGMKHFILQPQVLEDLTWCKSSYNSLYGKIRSEWKTNNKGGIDVWIEVPKNTSAIFILPGQKHQIKNLSGVLTPAKKMNNRYEIEFKPGSHKFEIL